jgi:hypothetical protein
VSAIDPTFQLSLWNANLFSDAVSKIHTDAANETLRRPKAGA